MNENKGKKGLSDSTTPIPPGTPPRLSPNKKRWWAPMWWFVGWVWVAFSAVGVIAGNLSYFQPRLTVSLGTFLDPAAPLSIRFTVTNDGYIPLRDVRYACAIKRLENKEEGGLFDFSFVPENSLVAGTLIPGHPATVSCQQITEAFKMPLPIVKGDIALWVQYRMRFIPWTFDEMRRFVTEPLVDGNLIWSPQPAWEEEKK